MGSGISLDNRHTMNRIGNAMDGKHPCRHWYAGHVDTGERDDDGNLGPQFDFPSGVAVVGTNVYVADTGGNLIRGITSATPWTVSTLAGNWYSGLRGYCCCHRLDSSSRGDI